MRRFLHARARDGHRQCGRRVIWNRGVPGPKGSLVAAHRLAWTNDWLKPREWVEGAGTGGLGRR